MPSTLATRVSHVWTGTPGLPGVSTTYVEQGTGNAAAAVSAWADFWDTMSDYIANDFTVTLGGTMETINVVSGQTVSVETVTPVSVQGTAVTQFLPTASQGVLEFLTGVFANGRQIRGKMFVPGIVEDQNEQGFPISTCISAFEAALNDVNDLGGMNGAWTVWSRANARQEYVTDSFMWSQWGVLRSRRD